MPTVTSGLPKRRLAPAFTLVLLAPVIAEVLSGATRLSAIFALIPEVMVWGCGTLIIRETARRRRLGWISLLLGGLALAIAEEFIIQQTSLAPLPWLRSVPIYGRALGVNWLYLLFMLGYESVWVVLVPVQLTELVFRKGRTQPWLGIPGLIATGLIFIIGSLLAWYAWMKRVRPMVFHVPPYNPPPVTILSGLLAIIVLIVVALKLRLRPHDLPTRPPAPWLLGAITVALGLPWYGIINLAFTSNPAVRAFPFWVVVIAGLAWAGMALLLISRWISAVGWREIHGYAMIFGAVLVPIIGGFAGSSSWPRIDLIGKVVFDVFAILLLIGLGRLVQKQSSVKPA